MINSQNPSRVNKSSVELFNIRLKTRICIAVVCMFQLITRIALVIENAVLHHPSPSTMLLVAIPMPPTMALIIGIEYLLFKKYGSKILKYSHIVDFILLILFTVDWIARLISVMDNVHKTNPASFVLDDLWSFTAFAWRTLLVTLIVQKWQLQIIAPVITTGICLGYTIDDAPGQTYHILLKGLTQLFNIIFVIYVQDKLKWKLLWTNLQQEKWMQVNNFILNNIPENTMILDLKGEIQFASDYCKTFMENLGLSLNTKDFLQKICHLQNQQQNVGIQIERLTTGNELLEDSKPSDSETLEDVLKSFKKQIIENKIQEKQFLVYNGKLKSEEDQQEKAIEVKISFVQHFENFYIVLILRDTTQRDLLITLQETDKYKDQLLASVSHELRAPLNGNINLVEAAVNSPDTPETLKESLLIPALRSSKFLLHLINDIIDISQIKQQKLRLVFQSEDIKETLKSTAQLVELQAEKKGLELILEFDPSLPKMISTDHIRLSQIVLNLLSNAVKFTKQGEIKLIAIPMSRNQWVKVIVEDSGIGISPENLDKLLSNNTGRQILDETGAGLGLNIASNLVQLLAPHGHQSINVISTLNKGSTFSFVIENKEKDQFENDDSNDFSRVPDEFAEDIQPILFPKLKTFDNSLDSVIQIETCPCSCPKILIVDDNPFNTMAFETILRSLNIKCDPVYSGSSAIERLLSRENKKCGPDCKQYSVIFMDQEMPEMSGSETVQEIRRLQRERELSQKIHILGCTAHKSKVEVDKFLASGFDGCIFKPISVTIIKETLCKFSM